MYWYFMDKTFFTEIPSSTNIIVLRHLVAMGDNIITHALRNYSLLDGECDAKSTIRNFYSTDGATIVNDVSLRQRKQPMRAASTKRQCRSFVYSCCAARLFSFVIGQRTFCLALWRKRKRDHWDAFERGWLVIWRGRKIGRVSWAAFNIV